MNTGVTVAAVELLEEHAHSDPLEQFAAWFADAERAGVEVPEAVALATATPDGAPSARMVLLKDFGASGFVFYSNYESRKGRELDENARAALLFYWHPLRRQVRVEGDVGRLGADESNAYFQTRPLGARLSAWASRQSEVVESRRALEDAVEELRGHVGEELAAPPHWGGYVLRPRVFEFWQHREDRLHDRLRYRRDGATWVRERLAP
jgi:pyridoxamine 5'-phosphate oxidase